MQSAIVTLLISLFLLSTSAALPFHRPHHFNTTSSLSTSAASTTAAPPPPQHPAVFFEVTKSIHHPPTTSKTAPCSHHVLSHDLGNTYGHPPVTAPYSPPSNCPFNEYSTVLLEFSATCQGRQFDRLFGIWLNGVELLRSCTAEPTRQGIFWKVEKDITKYSSLLTQSNQTLALYVGNVVDETYTGIYHVNVTFHYYPLEKKKQQISSDLYGNYADLVLPVSRDLPLNDGLWFKILNSTDLQSKEVVIPRNAYRAVLEVYLAPQENDEFWYSNVPNDYLMLNNIDGGLPGNGVFREVLVKIDGELVGAVWPFTVIYTGGVNPLLWRPISAIGSFDLPTYDIEITPFLGNLLDGKSHNISFGVTNSLNVWYVNANLHLWLDNDTKVVEGELLENIVEPLTLATRFDIKSYNGKFFTGARRSIRTKGWVKSSKGNVTTFSTQEFYFKNNMILKKDGNLQILNQTIDTNTRLISVKLPYAPPYYVFTSRKNFPLYMYSDEVEQGSNGAYNLLNNVTLGFNEDNSLTTSSSYSSSALRNEQKGEGTMLVQNNLVSSGLGSTHQVYRYNEKSDKFCYFRNVSSYNYTIVYDEVREKCVADNIPPLANLDSLLLED